MTVSGSHVKSGRHQLGKTRSPRTPMPYSQSKSVAQLDEASRPSKYDTKSMNSA